jgi:hypothetical protein
MRSLIILGTLATALVGGGRSSHAYHEGPWCAVSWGGDSSYENCSMRSFEMCMNEIHGTGGNTVCSPNPRYQRGSTEIVEPSKPSRRQRSN